MDELREPKPHHMGLQISCGFHSEISAQDIVSGTTTSSGRDFPTARATEGIEGSRLLSTCDARPVCSETVERTRGLQEERGNRRQESRGGLWRARRAPSVGDEGRNWTSNPYSKNSRCRDI